MNYKEAISFEELYKSMNKCKKGVMWKESTSSFVLNGLERIYCLKEELESETYTPREPYKFEITSPKHREIISICFKDRIYQRSLNDNILYPTMTKSFIKNNCACQIGKGSDFARNILKEYLKTIWNKNRTNDFYVLQCDIRGYYPNMPHEYTENLFESKLDFETFYHIRKILRHQYRDEAGYSPGSQLIQIAGISDLDKLDHFIKEKLHIKYYVRYMDDFILIHEDKDYLAYCLNEIKKFLNNDFEISRKKTKIFSLKQKDIPFLGFKFKLTNSGKVLLLPKMERISQQKKHLKSLVKRCKDGRMNKENVDMAFNSILAFLEKGNTYYVRQRLTTFYNNLWEN